MSNIRLEADTYEQTMKYMEIKNEAKKSPMTLHRIDLMIDYIVDKIRVNEKARDKKIERGEDTEAIEYEIARCKYVLGLRNSYPDPYWIKRN